MAGNKLARVYHAELWGTREQKYRVLWERDVETTEWAKVEAAEPRYFFTPRGTAGAAYRAAPSMTDIFRQTGQGIESQRDAVAVGFTRQEVEHTVSVFLHD